MNYYNFGMPFRGPLNKGGYSGPSAAELEVQAAADFERQKLLLEEQRRIAREEREYQDQLQKEAEEAEEAKKAADLEKQEEAAKSAQLAASEEAADAADVSYDPNSGSVLRLLRDEIQIPESGDSQ